jgi:Tfp pilus assembly protein PilO
MSVMQQGWLLLLASSLDSAKRITAKFKNLRKALKTWKAQLPNLATVIANSREIISFMDILEEMRDLTLEEWNFRRIVSSHLEQLLEQQRTYWK